MKKNLVSRILVFFLIVGVSVYFYNEYKTKSLLNDLLHIENLDEEKDHVTIINESILEKGTFEDNIVNIDKYNPIFPSLINSLENLKVKRDSKAKFSYSEGYTFIIRHNHIPYHVSINENGALAFDNKNYKIQGPEIKELLDITKKGTQ